MLGGRVFNRDLVFQYTLDMMPLWPNYSYIFMSRRSVASTLALLFLKLSLPWKPDASTTCFKVWTFNLCKNKTKAQKIKVATWKRKHETAKWHYLTLLSCENTKTIVSCQATFIINMLICHRWGKNTDCYKQQVGVFSLFVLVVCCLL